MLVLLTLLEAVLCLAFLVSISAGISSMVPVFAVIIAAVVVLVIWKVDAQIIKALRDKLAAYWGRDYIKIGVVTLCMSLFAGSIVLYLVMDSIPVTDPVALRLRLVPLLALCFVISGQILFKLRKTLQELYSKPLFQIMMIVVFMLLSRLPFIWSGFGQDADTWRIACSGLNLLESHQYVPSRFPGYPIPEMTAALTWLMPGIPLLNMLTVIISTVGAVMLGLIMLHYGFRDAAIGSLAVFFIPVVYINSTNSMDYIWALTPILAAFYAAMDRRPALAGILMGVAVGSRLTSVIMALPVGLLLWLQMPAQITNVYEYSRQNWRSVLVMLIKFAFFMTATVLVSYFLLWSTYGLGFLQYYENQANIHDVINMLSKDLWGKVGWVAFATGVILYIVSRVRDQRAACDQSKVRRVDWVIWLVAVSVVVIFYVRYPYEAGYLIPALPFLMLLLARGVNRVSYLVVCVLFLLSPFVDVDRGGVYSGPLLVDRIKRANHMDEFHKIYADISTQSEEVIFVPTTLDDCVAELIRKEYESSNGNIANMKIEVGLPADDIEDYAKQGYAVYQYADNYMVKIYRYIDGRIIVMDREY